MDETIKRTALPTVTGHRQNPTEPSRDVAFRPFRYPAARHSTCRLILQFLLLTSLLLPNLTLRNFSAKKIDRLMTLWEITAAC